MRYAIQNSYLIFPSWLFFPGYTANGGKWVQFISKIWQTDYI
jgi:hypothetical protein